MPRVLLQVLSRATGIGLAVFGSMGVSGSQVCAQQPGLEVVARSVHVTRNAQPFLSRVVILPASGAGTIPGLDYAEAPAGNVWLVLDVSLKARAATSLPLNSIYLAVPGRSEVIHGYFEQTLFTHEDPIYRDQSAIWQDHRIWMNVPAGESDIKILFAAPAEALDGGVVQIDGARPLRVEPVLR